MGRFSARVAAAGIGAGAGAASSSSAAAAAAAGAGAGEPYDAEEAVFLHNLVWLSYLDADGPGGEKCLEHRPAWMRAGGAASGVPSLRAALRNGAVAAGAGGGRGALRLLEFCEHRETDTQAYFAATEAAPSEVVFSVRGTTTLADWLTNASCAKTLFEPEAESYAEVTAGCCAWVREGACAGGGARPLVHYGSYCCLLALKAALNRRCVDPAREGGLTRLTVCGHSLGAMVAVQAFVYVLAAIGPRRLAEAGVHCTLYTEGAPRVGTDGFLALVDTLTAPLRAEGLVRVIRMVNDIDIIPRIPRGWGFKHFGLLHLFKDAPEPDEGESERGRALMYVGQYACRDAKLSSRACEGRARRWLGNVGRVLSGEFATDHSPLMYGRVIGDQVSGGERKSGAGHAGVR